MVFILSEFLVRAISYRAMVFVDLDKKKEKAVIDLTGYISNILIGVLMGIVLNASALVIIGFICGSLIAHIIWIEWIEKKIKSFAKKKRDSK